MPIIATATETRHTPAPEGTHQAVCVDVIDKGIAESAFLDEKTGQPKKQHKIDIAWQINDLRDDGKRFVAYKRYTLSLNEKATLRKDLESWRGRPFTRDEEMGFDVETVIGANCLLNIVHKPGTKDPSKVFANVVSVMPLIKGMPKLTPLDYVRAEQPQAPVHNVEPEYHEPVSDELTDDDIPFAWILPLVLPLTGALAAMSVWS